MYTCGPTVYGYVHIGNFRTYISADLLVRTLQYNGYPVKYIMNITDVGHLTGDNLGDADTGEDRLEKASQKEGKTEIKLHFNTQVVLSVKRLRILCLIIRPQTQRLNLSEMKLVECLRLK